MTLENTKEFKRLLRLKKKKKQKNPKFVRCESWRYPRRVKPRWRRPRGIDNKMAEKNKGWPALVSVGYGIPLRHRHSSGREEVLVHNINDLDLIDPTQQVVRVGGKVGRKKKKEIMDQADIYGLHVLNRIPEISEIGEIEEYEFDEDDVTAEELEGVEIEDLEAVNREREPESDTDIDELEE
ncbi:MAG: 50S ribosomal protein L32e [Candidatus Hodarchaeales archaeon]